MIFQINYRYILIIITNIITIYFILLKLPLKLHSVIILWNIEDTTKIN